MDQIVYKIRIRKPGLPGQTVSIISRDQIGRVLHGDHMFVDREHLGSLVANHLQAASDYSEFISQRAAFLALEQARANSGEYTRKEEE